MRRDAILRSGELAPGRPYAERSDGELGWHDKVAEFLVDRAMRPLRDRVRDPRREMKRIVKLAALHERQLRRKSDAELKSMLPGTRSRLRQAGFERETICESFALVREVARRTIGQRHYDVQLMGGWALLQGRLVEMATGEGKTLVATLPASVVALAGYPVHIVTVNDYLAARDAEEMEPLYHFLGLTVGTVVQGMQRPERRQAYSKSVTYCTNKELAFDYLRDRVALSGRGSRLHLSLERLGGNAAREEDLVLRGLHYAIVDEADSVFIDEARTPLILSSSTGPADEKEQCEQALALARQLSMNEDYKLDLGERSISLRPGGQEKLAELTSDLKGIWTSTRGREELIRQALTALILFRRDQHYVVSEGKVQIVDESTGRVMPDRSWERGLHQLIEVKEGCEPTQRRETIARLTYQRLFRRYVRLAGMTGTGGEVAHEVRRVYGLQVAKIPLHRPSRRTFLRAKVCGTRAEKWRDVADCVEQRALGIGQPVLIGTRSVQASEEISAVLHERGIEHLLLNAKQDRLEANIIAGAGQAARGTVATNMAGRGTDIKLGEGVPQLGGLHVILTEFHESQRIDRQLFGRCARQGDPGTCQAITSLEDELYVVHGGSAARLVRRLHRTGIPIPLGLHDWMRRFAQHQAERRGAFVRLQNLQLDRRLERVLAFSGRGE